MSMKNTLSQLVLTSPIGNIRICGNSEYISEVTFTDDGTLIKASTSTPDVLLEGARQLDEYFSGLRQKFNLPLKPEGTPFQQQVWDALQEIPYGRTASYGDIAEAVGKPEAARAVGMANNRNPIGIMIPCHRVIGKNGNLTGYGGGLWRKEWLLNHERNNRIHYAAL